MSDNKSFVVIDNTGKRVWPLSLYETMEVCLCWLVLSGRNDLRVLRVGGTYENQSVQRNVPCIQRRN